MIHAIVSNLCCSHCIALFLRQMNSQLEQRPSFVARMSEESLEKRLLAAPSKPAPARATRATPAVSTAVSTKAAVPAQKDGFDIPVIPVVGVVAAAFAAATFSLRSGKNKREVEQSSSPSSVPVAKADDVEQPSSPRSVPAAKADDVEQPSSPSSVSAAKADETDVSIPYDAAARLEYDHSDKSMEYSKFKEKYEADTIAYIKAKQKK
jgi:hypothetical protein